MENKSLHTVYVEEACRESLLVYTENLADDERGHLRSEYFISNKEDDHSVFQQIRRDIINLARGMRIWNKDYPLKFIQLEQRLQEKKKALPIITYEEIKHISTDTPKPLSKEELILFLEYHHELRSLVYFKDLPENIILDTQWLSDAFKCIVTARKFQASTKKSKKWNEFYHTGKLSYDVIEDIFKKETNILYEHKDYILNVMEKFDIIIRSNKLGANKNPYFYVPCMIKAEPEHDIYEMFNVPKDIHKRSTWLCFKFRFLPPHLMNHLIASLSRKYTVAEVVDSKKKKRQIALFKGTAVFELQHETTKLRKLLVVTCPNVIQIQVWEFGEDIKRGLYKYIADFVTGELNTVMHTRFKMSNVKFEKTWECGLTEPKCVTGSNKFMEEPITEYQCETCLIKHMFNDEWSDQQNKAPTLPQISGKAQHVSGSSSCIEITSPTKLFTAAKTGNVKDVKICLENKADIDYQGVGGWTALMYAAWRGHLEICRLLIDTGCKIDTTTSVDGWTALMFAARYGHLEICRLLIDTGCKIDITSTMDGYTALHLAAEEGHLQVIRCLVELGGASPLVKTPKGKTPYDLAAAKLKNFPRYKEVIEYLQAVVLNTVYWVDGTLGCHLQVVVLNTVYWVDGTFGTTYWVVVLKHVSVYWVDGRIGYPYRQWQVQLNTVYWVDGTLNTLTGVVLNTVYWVDGKIKWIPLQAVVLNTVYWVDGGRLGYLTGSGTKHCLLGEMVDLDKHCTGSGTKHCLLGKWVHLDTHNHLAVVLNTVYWVDGTLLIPLQAVVLNTVYWVNGTLGYPYHCSGTKHTVYWVQIPFYRQWYQNTVYWITWVLQAVVLNTVYWVDGTLEMPLQAVVLNTVYWVDGTLGFYR
ncbi:unnamed protein product [Mytilus coruscus]|uniref:COR domain-containing protein n=1 Tax=Mytilus coruscus TaxID=42192 RepID=A0A6J8CTD1_MYTCO|nr:unnamed protein product [Mytilus coruscus]